MFSWNQQVIGWMEHAAAETNYHRVLASKIAAALPANALVTDVGCGLGHLSKALCAQGCRVIAVDKSENAAKHLSAQNVPRLQVVCGDALTSATETAVDGAVFCYFGSVEGILGYYRSVRAKKLFVVRSANDSHMFTLSPTKRRRGTLPALCDRLEREGIPYTVEHFTFAYGQPFVSVEDAEMFFQFYNDGELRPADWDLLRKKLVRREGPLPFYFPAEKKVGLVCFGE